MSNKASIAFLCLEAAMMGAPSIFPSIPHFVALSMFWGGSIGLFITLLWMIFGKKSEENLVREAIINQAVTSYNQSGGITARDVHIGDVARSLTEDLKTDLLSKVNRNKSIAITHIVGDSEAYKFAREIGLFLRSKGYDWKYFMSDGGIYGGNGAPSITEYSDSVNIYVSSKGDSGTPLQFTGGSVSGLKPE